MYATINHWYYELEQFNNKNTSKQAINVIDTTYICKQLPI